MGNFIETFKAGQKGQNKGIPLGPGLETFSKRIHGLQRGMTYAIASPPKTGKSTFVDYAFVIHPFLYAIENNIPMHWVYLSFEMDRITKEFDFAAYFMYHDFGIEEVSLPSGVTVMGENKVQMSSDYLRGRIQDDNGNIVLIHPIVEENLRQIYTNRLVPIFGEFNAEGNQITKGVVTFVENSENPTGIYNNLLAMAEKRGEFIYKEYQDKDGNVGRQRVGYTPYIKDEFVVVIIDTVRKVQRERNFSVKETVDKMLEYTTILRNMCKYSFVPIIHLNRSIADVNSLRFMGDKVYGTPEQLKDTGNVSEEANHVITMFNPYDDRYNLKTHFGLELRDRNRNKLYPGLKTLHLVESRQVPFPQHFRVIMNGGTKNFKPFGQEM